MVDGRLENLDRQASDVTGQMHDYIALPLKRNLIVIFHSLFSIFDVTAIMR